jgi:hypothetical protein
MLVSFEKDGVWDGGGGGGTYMFAELVVVCVLHLFRSEYDQSLDLKSEHKEENEE